MRIVAPIADAGEIEMLSGAGAREFHCGFISDAEFDRAIHVAHRNACSISLVLDAPGRADGRPAAVIANARSFLDRGGDALIVSDLGLIGELLQHVPLRRIHVGSDSAGCGGSAARFYEELGVARMILPRGVRADEVCAIAAEARDLEIEALVPGDAAGMPSAEGLCELPILLKGGVAAVGIAGGAMSTAAKAASVRGIRAVLAWAEGGVGTVESASEKNRLTAAFLPERPAMTRTTVSDHHRYQETNR